MAVSPQRRREIVDALRRGTVPEHSLDAFAVGLAPFEEALVEELGKAKGGAGAFKALPGEYVALTRASRSLTALSRSAILTPAATDKEPH